MSKRNLKRVLALFMSVVLIVTGIKLTNRETYAADYPTVPGDDDTINVSYYDLPEYSEDDILGAAQHFLLFGKESATIGTHTNGNIAAPVLNTLIDTAGGSFVMNGMQALGYVIPNGNYRLISYVGDAQSDSQYMGIKGNGHLLVVDGDKTVLSSDKREINGRQLTDDFTNVLYENPNVPFIDFEKEFAHFERLSQKLVDFQGNQHKTRADVIEGDGQQCTLTVGNGVTVLSLTAADLDTTKEGCIRKDFHLIDIQSQGQLTDKDGKAHQVVSANQVVIINVDLAGETDYNMIHDVKYRFTDGELVANDESTVYNGTNILWNFYDSSASDKLYHGQITTSGYTMGVLLAPAATIRAHASNGTVIGKNVATYQGECHRSDFLPKSIPGLKLYKLTYDKNADDAYLGSGDTAVTDATVYEYNKPATIKNNNDTSTPGNWRRTGYQFLGWSENASDTKPTYKAGDTIKMNSDKTLYAIWEKLPQYTVTYHKTIAEATGSQTDSKSPYYKGSTVTVLDQGTMAATGYQFLGWNPDEAAAKAGTVDTNYDPADTFTITKNMDLYAVWSKIPKYTVTYHKTIDAATKAPVDAKSPYLKDSTVTVLGAGAMKAEGYKFLGWNPDENAAKAGTIDPAYDPADTFKITKNTDLYAVWEKLPQYKVTYHEVIELAGGNAPKDNNLYYSGSKVTVLDDSTMQAPSGFTFNGWNTNKEAAQKGEIEFKPGQKFEIQADTDLYAVWFSQPLYKVTYHPVVTLTSGTVPTDTTGYLADETVTVSDAGTMVADGYKFVGWNPDEKQAKEGKADPAYDPADTFKITKDTDLYAVWVPYVKITYHPVITLTGGSVPVDANSPYLKGSDVTVLGQGTMEADGYAFKGWNPVEAEAKKGNTSEKYAPGTSFQIQNDTDLYAVWQPKVKITYVSPIALTSGSEPVDLSSPYQAGSPVTVMDQGTMVADGYDFVGWNLDKEIALAGNANPSFTPGSTFEINVDTILYAAWKEKPVYEVTYHETLKEASSAPVDADSPYHEDSTVTVLDQGTMTAEGYAFLGWTTSEKAAQDGIADAAYAPGKTFTIQGDTDLYAAWKKLSKYKVTYHETLSTASAAPTDVNSPYYEGSNVTVLGQGTMKADGYVFRGWNPSEKDAQAGIIDKAYDPADKFTITKDTDLYAVWGTTVTVTYYPVITLTSGAAPVDANSPYAVGSTVTVLDKGTMVADGYVFKGWNPSEDAAKAGTVDTNYDPADTFSIMNDTDLYAVWVPQVKVTYHPVITLTSGTAPVDANNPYLAGDTVTVLDKGTMVADGYVFLGWNPDATAAKAGTVDTSYDPADTFTITKDTDLYAVWKKYYTVGYDPDGGVPTPEDTTEYADGATVTITSELPVKEGFTFAGWSQDPTDSTKPVLKAGDNTTKIQGSDITFIAVWTPNYNVTYYKNADDATGTQKDINNPYESGETVTVLGSGSIVRSGYSFLGWNTDATKATAGEVEFQADDTFIITKDTDLYAVWKKYYVVGYDPNGGSGEPSDDNRYYDGDKVTVPSDVPSKKGFDFKGWSTDPSDPDAPLYQVGDTVTVNGKDITFTAVWSKINDQPIVVYAVTYDPAGGVPTPEDTTEYVDGATVIVTGDVPAKDGYTFMGWSMDPTNPNAKLLKGGDTTTIQSDNITFTAIWTPNYVVIYNKNADDATGTQKDINNPYESGETVAVLGAGEIARVGYVFKGWATTASDTTVAYTEGSTFVITADTTLYAVWEALPTYKVVYDPNGGSGEPADVKEYKDGDTVTVPADVPVKTGYIFQGWTLDPSDPDAKLLKNGDTTTIQGRGVTFTAVWKADPNTQVVVLFMVTYDPQGGSPAPVDTTEYVDGASVIVTSDVPVKDGFVLDGWTLDPNAATPVLLTGGQTAKINGSDLTFYAVWTPVYTVDYNADGASSTPKDEKKYRNGEKATVVKDIPVVEGKRFKGWTTDPTDTANLLQNGDTVTIDGKNIILYAVFENESSSTFTVKYNLNGAAGTAPVDSNQYESGSSVTIVRDIPSRDGYTFTGWSLTIDGSATYNGGSSYTITTDTTFYAVWTPSGSAAHTGDPTEVMPWTMLTLVSAAGCALAVVKSKKKEDEE